jgi:DNA-binding XRE family transcriptional regulator
VRYDERRIPNIKAFLTAKLGVLAHFVEGKAETVRDGAQLVVEPVARAERAVLGEMPVPIIFSSGDARDTVAEGYVGGILPERLRALSRKCRRAAAISQDDFARRVGLSRSQIANAEAGRFGLSPDAARFLAVVVALPERQGSLFGSP